MRFGFSIPNRGPLGTAGTIRALARRAEELQFDIVAVSDHIIIPRRIDSTYPYSATGAFAGAAGAGESDYIEQLTVLSYLAACTSTVELLTSVMVVPYRPAVLAAKMLASIDVLSGGRVVVGCGAGWMREEFEALGAPPFEKRGAVVDEYLGAFRELWTAGSPSFTGDYCAFDSILFEPKPARRPHPPLWIGGESPAALRRAGRLGDGWYPITSNPRYPLDTPGAVAAAWQRVQRHAEAAGRDPSSLTLAVNAGRFQLGEPEIAADGSRRSLTGPPAQIAEDIGAYAAAGVQTLILRMVSGSIPESEERMERFMAEVAPLCR